MKFAKNLVHMILISLTIICVYGSEENVSGNIVGSETEGPFMKIAQHSHLTHMVASYLHEEYRKELRSKSKRFASKIPSPNYIQFRSGSEEATARLETNFGAVETRGNPRHGGDSLKVAAHLQSDVVNIFSSYDAFAALKKDGSVITWGSPNYGGDSSKVATDLQSAVVNIFSTYGAFAALKKDGSVIAWGDLLYGGDSSAVARDLQSDVVNVLSTNRAFAALKKDGSVIIWGHPSYGGDSSAVARDLQSDVVNIFSTYGAFAALKKDGSVITWGHPNFGGDSSSVAVFLSTGIVKIETIKNPTKFRATKRNGSQVEWPN